MSTITFIATNKNSSETISKTFYIGDNLQNELDEFIDTIPFSDFVIDADVESLTDEDAEKVIECLGIGG